jgi:hypothetical protein
MPRRKKTEPPREELKPMIIDEDAGEMHRTGHQRSSHNDPAMRDGNSSHGSPDYDSEDDRTTDNDVGDELDSEPPYAGPAGGAVGGTPAEKRAKGGRTRRKK